MFCNETGNVVGNSTYPLFHMQCNQVIQMPCDGHLVSIDNIFTTQGTQGLTALEVMTYIYVTNQRPARELENTLSSCREKLY